MCLRKKSTTKNKEEEIEKKLKEYFNLFDELKKNKEISTKVFEEKCQEVQFMIDHVNGRIEYVEDRLSRFFYLSFNLIVAGITIFSILETIAHIYPNSALSTIGISVGIFGGVYLIITGTVSLFLSGKAVNPSYPFRALDGDWKWFYPNIIPEEYKPSFWGGNQKSLDKKLIHVEKLLVFGEKILKEDLYERLKTDIQQLFLLHVNEKYKNKFLTHQKKILIWAIPLGLVLYPVFLFFT